jgi:hypothetical protein
MIGTWVIVQTFFLKERKHLQRPQFFGGKIVGYWDGIDGLLLGLQHFSMTLKSELPREGKAISFCKMSILGCRETWLVSG